MKSLNTKLQKFIVIILIVGLITPAIFLHNPKNVNAGVTDDAANWGNFFKNTLFDGIAYGIGNVIVAKIGKHAVDYIRSGFKMPDGTTDNFFSNPGKYLKKSVDEAVGQFVAQEIPWLCSPFTPKIEFALKMKYGGRKERSDCTFTGIKGNVETAFTNFAKDFNKGGWKSWIDFSVNPRNNVYGAFIEADAKLGFSIDGAGGIREEIKGDLLQGGGFLSLKEKTCDERAQIELVFNESGSINYRDSIWVEADGTFFADLKKGQDVTDAPCVSSTTTVKTPGKYLSDQLSKSLGINADRLGIADEINEIVGALISQLIQVGFDSLGLSGGDVSGSEKDSSLARIKKSFKEFKETMSENIIEFIDIKERSLSKTAGYTVGELLGSVGDITSVEKGTKIDWNGNNFSWSEDGIYKNNYFKIDWDGDEYNWFTGIYYLKDENGAMRGAKCEITRDIGAESYVITKKASEEKPSKAYWSKSICESTSENTREWSDPVSNTLAFGSIPTETVCDASLYNDEEYGYKINENNKNNLKWEKNSCLRFGGGYNFDNAKWTPTGKNIYKTSDKYVQKIGWIGYSFNWEKDVFYYLNRGNMQPLGEPLWKDSMLNGKACIVASATDAEKMFAQSSYIVLEEDNEWSEFTCVVKDNTTGAKKWNITAKYPATFEVLFDENYLDNLIRQYLNGETNKEIRKYFQTIKIPCYSNASTTMEIYSEETLKTDKTRHKITRFQLAVDILRAQDDLKKTNDISKILDNIFDSSDPSNSLSVREAFSRVENIKNNAGYTEEDLEVAREEQETIENFNTVLKMNWEACEEKGSGRDPN